MIMCVSTSACPALKETSEPTYNEEQGFLAQLTAAFGLQSGDFAVSQG